MSNSLATVHPELVAEWSDRNYPLLPTQVTVFANRKAWWKYKICGYESKRVFAASICLVNLVDRL